jgi:lipoate-protein ligase A
MAMDVALARSAAAGEAVLRIYRWVRPTLSFGRNQQVRGHFDLHAAEGIGAAFLRRPTGGREVLHDRELTYSAIFPAATFGGLRTSYRLLNTALVEALRSVGVKAALADPPGRTPHIESGPCFELHTSGEVAVERRKIAGSAQRRFGGTVLQHGSLLLAPPSVAIDALRAPPPPDLHLEGSRSDRRAPSWRRNRGVPRREPSAERALPVTLAELIDGSVSFSRIASAVEAAMAGALGGKWRRGEATNLERVVAEGLLSQYESAEWTWRR